MFTNSNPRLDSFKGCSEAAFDILLTYLHEDSLSDSQLTDIYTNFMVLISSFNTNNNLAIETTSTIIECIPYKSLLQIRDSIKLTLPSLSSHDSVNLLSLIKNIFLSFKKFQFISFFDLILKFNSIGKLSTGNLIPSIKKNGSFSLSKIDILSDFSDNDLILSKSSILEILILYLSANFKASKIELISIQTYLAAFLGFNHIYITFSDDSFIPKFSDINYIDSLPDALTSENIPNPQTVDLVHLAHRRTLLFNKSFSFLELLLDTCWSDYQENSLFYDLVYKDSSQTNENFSTNSSYLSNLLKFTTKNIPFISDDIESQTSQFTSYPIPQNIPHPNIKSGVFFVQFDQLAIDNSLQRLSGAIGTQIYYVFNSLINSCLVGEGRKKLVRVLHSFDKLFEDNDEDIKLNILHIPVINSINLLEIILENDDSPTKAILILSLVNSYIKCHEKNNDSNISLFNHKFSAYFLKRSLETQLSEIIKKNSKKFTNNEERSKFGRETIEFTILLARNTNSMTLKFSDECRLLQSNILIAILSNFDITEKSLFNVVESYYYISANTKFRPPSFFLTSHDNDELKSNSKTCYRNILMELARDSKKFNQWNNDIFDFEIGSLGLKFIMNFIQNFKPDSPICFSSKSAFNVLKFIQKKCQSISKEVEDSVLQYKKIIKSPRKKSSAKGIDNNTGNKGIDLEEKSQNIPSSNIYSEPRDISSFNDTTTSPNLRLKPKTFTPYNGKENSIDLENIRFRDYDDRDYLLLFEIAEKDFSEDSCQTSDNNENHNFKRVYIYNPKKNLYLFILNIVFSIEGIFLLKQLNNEKSDDLKNSSINNEFKSRLANILLPKKDNYCLPLFFRPTHNIRDVDILEFEKYYWALNSYIQKTSNFNGAYFFDSKISAVELIHSEVLDKYNSTYYFPPGSEGLSQYSNFSIDRLNIRLLHNNVSPFRKDLLKKLNYVYNFEFVSKLMDTMENNISKNYLWANSRASSWVLLVSILGRISKAILNAKLLTGINQNEINKSPAKLDLSRSSFEKNLDSFADYQLKKDLNNYSSKADLEIPIDNFKFNIDSTLPNSNNTDFTDIQSKKSSLTPTDDLLIDDGLKSISCSMLDSISLKNQKPFMISSDDSDQLISNTNGELKPIQNGDYNNKNDREYGTSNMNNYATDSKDPNYPSEVDINISEDAGSCYMSKHNIQMSNIDITPSVNSSKPRSLSDIDGSTAHINSENYDKSLADSNFNDLSDSQDLDISIDYLELNSYIPRKTSGTISSRFKFDAPSLASKKSYGFFSRKNKLKKNIPYKKSEFNCSDATGESNKNSNLPILSAEASLNFLETVPDDIEYSVSCKSGGNGIENEGRDNGINPLNQEACPEEEFSEKSMYFGLDSLELDVDRILAMMHGPEMVIIETLNMMLDDDDL
ncbi:hypothetical protein AYI69_g2343 [Smittium culicis]|uniref:Uncharacterized protein n=1 Tax=Smittium culicis TaxID=133412 RepID=A0A1R1YMR6_9FUNG|nr:hypothetical protein AYI69_g2343 [Smittium culicis]